MTTDPTQPADVLSDLTGRAVDAYSAWADTNQKVLRHLVDLSASTSREGVRLYAELQSSAVEAIKEGQSSLLRRQNARSEASPDPLSGYPQSAQESVASLQRAVRLFEGTAQAMTRSAERLQVSADHTGKEIQAALGHLAGKLQALSTPLA